MKAYTISGNEGLKLLTDCACWFNGNIGLAKCFIWIAGRCKAPTLSANVKMEAAAQFLSEYFDIEQGFDLT